MTDTLRNVQAFEAVTSEPAVLAPAPLAPGAMTAPRLIPSPAGRSPSTLDRPAFLMGFPFSYSTRVANNPWMQELAAADREPNLKRAYLQFADLYRYLSSEGLVYLLPTPARSELQDLVFTGNLGIVLEHLPGRDAVVLSNYTSEPRRGETGIGRAFFEALGYETHVAPRRFEGEAELKHVRDNLYVGGYGIRSELECYEWMEETFDMKVVKVALQDPYLYHLDCTFFPITHDHALVCTALFEPAEVREIEKHVAIIDVTLDECYSGICNNVRLSNTILNASHLNDMKAGTEDYDFEKEKNRRLEDITAGLAFEVAYFNLSEYLKGGALLSCMVMHLNRHSYRFPLT